MHYQLKAQQGGGGYIEDECCRFVCSHMSTARKRAIHEATEYGVPIMIERVTDGALEGREGFERGRAVPQVKAVLIVNPDGSSRPPENVEAGGTVRKCTASPAGPPCFCDNCRAVRKVQR